MKRLLLILSLVGAGYLLFLRSPAPHQRIYHYKDATGRTVFTNEILSVPPKQRAVAMQSEDLAKISTANFDELMAVYGPEQREERRKRLEAEGARNANLGNNAPPAAIADSIGQSQTVQQGGNPAHAPEFNYKSEVNYGCFSGNDGGICATGASRFR